MDFSGVHYVAVMLAAAASFIFGGIWYGIFSKQWMAAAGMKMADLKPKDGPVLAPYISAFFAELIMAFALAALIVNLVPGMASLSSGLIVAVLVWAGFVASSLVVNHAFQGANRMLTLIDGGHWLGVLLIQGAVLGWMGAA